MDRSGTISASFHTGGDRPGNQIREDRNEGEPEVRNCWCRARKTNNKNINSMSSRVSSVNTDAASKVGFAFEVKIYCELAVDAEQPGGGSAEDGDTIVVAQIGRVQDKVDFGAGPSKRIVGSDHDLARSGFGDQMA